MSPPSFETYHGYIRTPLDAIYLFEACRIGRLQRVQRRLTEKERQLIAPGSIFVWDEQEAGMKRWTDGKAWSASRVSGSFLTYREMEGKKPMSLNSASNSDDESSSDSGLVSISNDGFQFKENGLMKQSFSITTSTDSKLHLVSYYISSPSNVSQLKQPSEDPMLKDIPIPHGIYPYIVHNTHGIPTNNSQQSIQPLRPQLPTYNQYYNHSQQVPAMPNGPSPPPHHLHPSQIQAPYPPPPPPPPIQTHPHMQCNPHHPYYSSMSYQQPPLQQHQLPLPPRSSHAYMYGNYHAYPASAHNPMIPPHQNPSNSILPSPGLAPVQAPHHLGHYNERSPSMPQTQSPIPPRSIEYSKRPSIPSPRLTREPSVSYPTPAPSIIHTLSQPSTPRGTSTKPTNRAGYRINSLTSGNAGIGKSPKASKSKASLPRSNSMSKPVSPIQHYPVSQPFSKVQQTVKPVAYHVNAPPSPRASFSNGMSPLSSFTSKDGTFKLPSLAKYVSSQPSYEKSTWREDIRAIQVLDKGFI